jgi:MoaA/NifB/PqqE/SkfB family radical SAM enzyme
MEKPAILEAIDELKNMGVVWLGITGGEPLLNRDLVEIVERASGGCAVKLFTTGSTLTPQLADALRKAGLFSVSVSLDHWKEEIHDRVRNCPGAFRTALRAISIFKDAGLHTGVSAVLSKEMIAGGQTPEFLDFLEGLGVHEAWLSETKPSSITGDERRTLMELQDRRNRTGHMTVNYLAHFEAGEHFGCNAGRKMIYVDAFGDVSPCVFVPMAFGNVGARPLRDIWRDMRDVFRPSSECFINRNYNAAGLPSAKFGPLSRFAELYSRRYHGRLP